MSIEEVVEPARQLLHYMAMLNVSDIIEEHYSRFGNSSPAAVFRMMVEDVEKALTKNTEAGL